MISKPLIVKELKDIFREKTLLSMMLIPLVVFSFMLPIIVVFNLDTVKEFSNIFIGKDIRHIGIYMSSVLLIIPIMISNTFCAYSIIGEKEKNTFESLFCTPLSIKEIINSKIFACIMISSVITIISFLTYSLVLNISSFVFLNENNLFIIPIDLFVLAILLIFTSSILVTIFAYKFNTAKGAQQLGIILVVPLAVTLFNINLIDNRYIIIVLICLLFCVNLILLRYIYKTFNYENILIN